MSLSKVFLSKFTSTQFFVDFIRICLYPADFSAVILSSKTNSVVEHLKQFLIDLDKVVARDPIPNSKQIRRNINTVKSILTIRDSGSNIITYSNVYQHISTDDLSVKQLIQQSISQKLYDLDNFRKTLDSILITIQAFYEVDSIGPVLKQLSNFSDEAADDDKPIFEALKDYKDIVIRAYSNLTKLNTLFKADTSSDYFLIGDQKSVGVLAKNITNYISQGYSFLKTGYDVIDGTVGGLESATFHLIMAPSNHAKSLFMVNLCRNVIEHNLSEFEPNDAILFVTLEDDIYKLSRRFISVFGNYEYNAVRHLFKTAYELMKRNPDEGLKNAIEALLVKLLTTSILNVTGGKVNLVIKHSNENSFSAGDLEQFTDRLRVDGYKVKTVFLDYIDVMTPTIVTHTKGGEYDSQGQIVHEVRVFSRNHKIPTISVSQNRREAEKETIEMSNELVGDSYKKVRYADYIYMVRKRAGLNFLSEAVRHDVLLPSNYLNDVVSPNILKIKDKLSANLTPFEIKNTKAKDADRGCTKFALFCNQNLRIYDNIQQYFDDADIIDSNTKRLHKEIKQLEVSEFGFGTELAF